MQHTLMRMDACTLQARSMLVHPATAAHRAIGSALVADLLRLEVLVALVTVSRGLLQSHRRQVSCRACCHMPTGMPKLLCSQSRCAEAGCMQAHQRVRLAETLLLSIPKQCGQPLTGAYLFTLCSSSRNHLNFDLQAALNEYSVSS